MPLNEFPKALPDPLCEPRAEEKLDLDPEELALLRDDEEEEACEFPLFELDWLLLF